MWYGDIADVMGEEEEEEIEENVCEENASLDSTFQICICDQGWYKSAETGECTSQEELYR